MASRICAGCLKETKGRVKRKLCSYCYSKVRTRESVSRTNENFKTHWAYNQYLWDLYIMHLGGKSVLNNWDPMVARKLSAEFQAQEIKKFKSWIDVYERRDQFRIGYSFEKNYYGCPITMLGRILEKEKLLPAKNQSLEFHQIYKCFLEPQKTQVKLFSERFFIKESARQDIENLKYIRDFYLWLQGDLFQVQNSQALDYLRFLSMKQNTLLFRDHRNALKAFYQWHRNQGLIHENPFDQKLLEEFYKVCVTCKKKKIVSSCDEICTLCHLAQKVIPWIENARDILKNSSTYNQYLFDLHFEYVKRYRITSASLVDAKKLAYFLSETKVEPLLHWKDIRALSEKFQFFHNKNFKIYRGCPFVKIGHRLSELGVIPFIMQDDVSYLHRAIKKLPEDIRPVILKYSESLLKRRRKHITAVTAAHGIRTFYHWLQTAGFEKGLFSVTQKQALNYLENFKNSRFENKRATLNQFYKWSEDQGLIEKNPFEKIKPFNPPLELPICSKEEFKKLTQFIKNPKTASNEAFALMLILFWGFSRQELLYSTYQIKNDFLEILVYQRTPSFGRLEPSRAKILKLPQKPIWVKELQKRFVIDWKIQFSQLKNPAPLKSLFLLPSVLHSRPMTPCSLQRMIDKSTCAATGKSIPMRIVRMTAGHVHTYYSDASLLRELGWSRSQSFKYSWMPRKFYC